MGKKYTVNDSKLTLILEKDREGGFVISSPDDPRLWTQAETLDEAFENARDALHELKRCNVDRPRRRF